MKTIKNSQLLVFFLILGITFCLPVVFAKAVNLDQATTTESQANVNENQANINENQANINENQADINEKQNKINEKQANTNKNQDNNSKLNGAEHRNVVATFVQSLLKVADRNQGGIGEQVKAIANEQNDSKDNVAEAIDKIQNRNAIKTFLIGTDYKNIGQLRSEMVKTGNQIDQLNRLSDQTTNTDDKAIFQAQIQVLTQEQQKINDFLEVNESKFSLFGWFAKLFNK